MTVKRLPKCKPANFNCGRICMSRKKVCSDAKLKEAAKIAEAYVAAVKAANPQEKSPEISDESPKKETSKSTAEKVPEKDNSPVFEKIESNLKQPEGLPEGVTLTLDSGEDDEEFRQMRFSFKIGGKRVDFLTEMERLLEDGPDDEDDESEMFMGPGNHNIMFEVDKSTEISQREEIDPAVNSAIASKVRQIFKYYVSGLEDGEILSTEPQAGDGLGDFRAIEYVNMGFSFPGGRTNMTLGLGEKVDTLGEQTAVISGGKPIPADADYQPMEDKDREKVKSNLRNLRRDIVRKAREERKAKKKKAE